MGQKCCGVDTEGGASYGMHCTMRIIVSTNGDGRMHSGCLHLGSMRLIRIHMSQHAQPRGAGITFVDSRDVIC